MYSFYGYFCCFSFRFILPLLKNPFPSSIECILSADTSAMGTQFSSSSSSSDATKWQRISIPVMTRCRRYVTRLICNFKYNIDDCIFLCSKSMQVKNAFQASCTKQNQNIRRTIHWNILCDVAIIIYNNEKPKHQKVNPPESLIC